MFLDVASPTIVFGEEVSISTISFLIFFSLFGFIVSLTFFMLEFNKKKFGKANNKRKLIVSGIFALLCISMAIYFFVKMGASRSGGTADPNAVWVQE